MPDAPHRYRCHYCGHVQPVDPGSSAETPCEDCGSHPAQRCSECEELNDSVWLDEVEDEPTREADGP